MSKHKQPKGNDYYKSLGFDKVIVVPLRKDLYDRLKIAANKDERTIQATARRLLEKGLINKRRQQ